MIRWICLLGLFFNATLALGYGGLTHMYLAEAVIPQLPDQTLQRILHHHKNAYLVGAYYPDSGYLKGAHYGEDSHWDEFIIHFADYLKSNSNLLQNGNLIAFLFGCASHRISDETFHRVFLKEIAEYDNKTQEKAHQYGDFGIDILVNMDKHQWLNFPTHWWVPVNHLVNIYKRMGKENYTAQQIIWGNMLIYWVGIGERLATPILYPYFRWKISWTANNYLTWDKAGIKAAEKDAALYMMSLWLYLQNKGPQPVFHASTKTTRFAPSNFFQEFASALQRANFPTTVKTDKDGNTEFAVNLKNINSLWVNKNVKQLLLK